LKRYRPDLRRLAWIIKLVGLPFALRAVNRGDIARDRCLFIDAVIEYRRALDWMPWREDLKIQVGNCLKEFGDYEGAVRAYGSVSSGTELAEARKQAGDAIARGGTGMLPFEVTDRRPSRTGEPLGVPPVTARSLPNRLRPEGESSSHWLGTLKIHDRIGVLARRVSYAAIKLTQIGTLLVERDAVQEPLLVGVVAIRGKVSTLTDLGQVQVWLGEGKDEQRVAIAPLHRMQGGGLSPLKMCSFNVWIDASSLPRGRHWLSVRTEGRVPAAGLFVTIGDIEGAPLASSDSFVPSPALEGRTLEQAVLEAPAQVRSATRSVLPVPVRSILAIRADQLGDVSASLQALRRLRQLFPLAKLTALVQPGVRAIVESSALVDEVLTLELSYSNESERRHLSESEERRISGLLKPREFDIAIDLSPGDESRPILLLSGATYLAGFNADRHAFLDFGISVKSRDKSNRLANVSHASSVLTLVEALGIAAASDPAPPVRPSGDGRVFLSPIELSAGRYTVIHTGARHALNCWPLTNYYELVLRLLASTDEPIVFFGGSENDPVLRHARVRRFDLAAPELFDAIISNARLMIGNDSGPKHLAAVRGVPTISIHVNRLNWDEWGQIGRGAIVSKRVPCAGCGLNDIELCAREAACVTSISINDVMGAVSPYLAEMRAGA
jgi:ADP-heptose:LPS heptosyltransferase